MQNFLGNPCPYCGKNFESGDDIVVCPECGTPHHRDCYKEHSACANEEKHSESSAHGQGITGSAAGKLALPHHHAGKERPELHGGIEHV